MNIRSKNIICKDVKYIRLIQNVAQLQMFGNPDEVSNYKIGALHKATSENVHNPKLSQRWLSSGI